jgi:hypothetical protein
MRTIELKIGNIVKLNNPKYRPNETGKTFSIIGFTFDNIRISDGFDDFGQLPEFIEPIPLTQEILEKLHPDFKVLVGKHCSVNRFKLFYAETYKLWRVYIDSTFITKVEFVHEWQNVYFALNGEELKLNK